MNSHDLDRCGIKQQKRLTHDFGKGRCAYKKGFTLIELLVVVAIIGILASMLLPSLADARARGKNAVCLSNQRQLGIANITYIQANNGIIVPTFIPGEGGRESKNNWTGLLGDYLSQTAGNGDFTSTDDLRVAACPEFPLRFGYGHNSAYLGRVQLSLGSNPGATFFKRLAEADDSSATVLFVDSGNPNKSSDEWMGNGWRPFVRASNHGQNGSVVDFRHMKNSANVVWLDGHATTRRLTDGFLRAGDVVSNEKYWTLEKQ